MHQSPAVPAKPGVHVQLTTARARLEYTAGAVLFRACDNEWEMATEAAPLLNRLITAVPDAVSLEELAAAAGITLDDAAAVITELLDGQAVAVWGGQR